MPNETTRLERAKESFRGIIPNPRRAAELLQWSAERTEVVELKNEILANSQAVLDLTEQIESLTAQLADAREAMGKASNLVSCESIEPCKGSIRCNGCEAKFILKVAIEAAGGVNGK